MAKCCEIRDEIDLEDYADAADRIVLLQAWMRGHVTRKWLQQVREEFEAVVKETDSDPQLSIEWNSQRIICLPTVKKKRSYKRFVAANIHQNGQKQTVNISENVIDENLKSAEVKSENPKDSCLIQDTSVATGRSCTSCDVNKEKLSQQTDTVGGCDTGTTKYASARGMLSGETTGSASASETPVKQQNSITKLSVPELVVETESKSSECPEPQNSDTVLCQAGQCSAPCLSANSFTNGVCAADPDVASNSQDCDISADVSHICTLDNCTSTLANVMFESDTIVPHAYCSSHDTASISHQSADYDKNVSHNIDARLHIKHIPSDVRDEASKSNVGAHTDMHVSRPNASSVSFGNDSTQHWGDSTSFWDANLSLDPESAQPKEHTMSADGLNPEELREKRHHIAMELLWVQQAIQSRKNYLRLKQQMKTTMG